MRPSNTIILFVCIRLTTFKFFILLLDITELMSNLFLYSFNTHLMYFHLKANSIPLIPFQAMGSRTCRDMD